VLTVAPCIGRPDRESGSRLVERSVDRLRLPVELVAGSPPASERRERRLIGDAEVSHLVSGFLPARIAVQGVAKIASPVTHLPR
jgi:hypothetical protein